MLGSKRASVLLCVALTVTGKKFFICVTLGAVVNLMSQVL